MHHCLQEEYLSAAHIPQGVTSILQLAVNTGYSMLATYVAEQLLPHVKDATVLLHVLHTAVLRGHLDVLEEAQRSQAIEQLEPAAILQLLQAAADQAIADKQWPSAPETTDEDEDDDYIGGTDRTVMKFLVQLPAAKAVAVSDIVTMMRALTTKHCWLEVKALCTLPAADSIPVNDMKVVLMLAMAKGSSTGLQALYDLTAAEHLTVDDIVRLMTRGVATWCYGGVAHLCTLPAAQHVTVDIVSQMLRWASKRSELALAALCSLPAAGDIETSLWVQCIKTAVSNLPEPSDYIGLPMLCSLPAAAQASIEDLKAVLKAAIQRQHARAVQALCKSIVAQHIVAVDVLGLVKLIAYRSVSSHNQDKRSSAY